MRDSSEEAARTYTGIWCADGQTGCIELAGGGRLRYLRAGSGPPLVLSHTERRQLDHFQLVIPPITGAFTVYAVDLPGMGWSDSSRAPVARSQPSGPPSCAWLSSWTSPT